MIQACAGAEAITQGPLEGDHMANGRVEMAVREVKRLCRTPWISAERNTSVRIADGSPLLSWLTRFAAQVMNKRRSGEDGKGSELRRTGRTWRKPMAQLGEQVRFVSSFARRMTQGISGGHHDRTGVVKCVTKNGVVPGAWNATNGNGLCGTPWTMVSPLPRVVLSAEIEAHGHTGGCPGCAALASHGKAIKPHNNERRERINTIIERILTGKSRMSAYTDGVAETESERK